MWYYMQRVKQVVEKWINSSIYPGASVLVQKNREIKFEFTAGFADQENRIPATPDDIWIVASIAKPIATAAFLQIVEKHKLKLDQSASDLLPEFHHHEITLRHLLTHTSGLGPLEPAGHPGDLQAIADQKLLFTPGTMCSYTTPAFDLIERIVCEFSGMPWSEYTKKHLFDPLGMNHSSYQPPHEWEERIPKVYDPENRVDPWWNARFLRAIGLAGGGLYSTPRDLAAFGQAFLDGGKPVLKRESCAEMLRLQTSGLTNLEGRPQTWGLGFYLNQDGNTSGGFGPLSQESFGHGGATGTWFCVDPQTSLIIVQLANRLGVTLENQAAMQQELVLAVVEELKPEMNADTHK
jgi:CubicO group peptidase (beta-lactamase class C family)